MGSGGAWNQTREDDQSLKYQVALLYALEVGQVA
jgi:hypothetical protein